MAAAATAAGDSLAVAQQAGAARGNVPQPAGVRPVEAGAKLPDRDGVDADPAGNCAGGRCGGCKRLPVLSSLVEFSRSRSGESLGSSQYNV